MLKTRVLEHGNASIVLSPGNAKRGPLRDAKSPFHGTGFSDHHSQAEFCGNCHNLMLGGGDVPVTVDDAAKAVAAYERTLITPDSAYDLYVKGHKSALTEQQLRGMRTFAEWGCIAYHRGPAFDGPRTPDGQAFFISFP